MKWKKYNWRISAQIVISVAFLVIPLAALNYHLNKIEKEIKAEYAIKPKTETAPVANTAAETKPAKLSEILGLSPERIEKLKLLYREVYSEPNLDSVHLLVGDIDISKKLKDSRIVYQYIYGDSVVVHNDTIAIPENLAQKNVWYTSGTSCGNVPQININHLSYDGEKEDLHKLASKANKGKDATLVHEIRHANNKKYMLGIQSDYRTRSLHAADELLAMVSGYLAEYAQIKDKQKVYNQYETTVYVGDINYVISGNVTKVLDSAITKAIDYISSLPIYRKQFIDAAGVAFRYDEPFAKDTNNAEAIKKMRSDFVINGKKVDIFSLASKKVRDLAENFINDQDEDMQIVKIAHDWHMELE